MNITSKNRISIIVPIYKKGKVIKEFLFELQRILFSFNLTYELILLIDGCKRSYTALTEIGDIPNSKIVLIDKNIGKGNAIRRGFEEVTSSVYVGFIDCGLDISSNSIKMFIKQLESDKYDGIIGDKYLKVSKREWSLMKSIISRGFTFIRKILIPLDFEDTQTGIKFFKNEVLKTIHPLLSQKRWLLDIEMLYLMRKKNFNNILVLPVDIISNNKNDNSSSMKITSIFLSAIDFLKLFIDIRVNKYK